MLSPRVTRFVAEYLVDLNGTAAAIRAGYAPRSAHVTSSRLLAKPAVQDAVAVGKAEQLARAGLSAERVLEEMRRCAFVDIRTFFDDKGNMRPIQDLPAEAASAVAGFEVLIKNAKAGDGETDTVHKFKLNDKVRVLEALGKHFGILADRLEIVDSERLIKRIAGKRQRLAAAKAAGEGRA